MSARDLDALLMYVTCELCQEWATTRIRVESADPDRFACDDHVDDVRMAMLQQTGRVPTAIRMGRSGTRGGSAGPTGRE